MTIETTYTQAREQLKTLMGRAVDDREGGGVRRRAGAAPRPVDVHHDSFAFVVVGVVVDAAKRVDPCSALPTCAP